MPNDLESYLLVGERACLCRRSVLKRESTLRNAEDGSRIAKTEYLAVLGNDND